MTARPDDMETPHERQRRIREEFGRRPGDYVGGVLRQLAEGPILDAYRAFCPAGRLTKPEMRAREAGQVKP